MNAVIIFYSTDSMSKLILCYKSFDLNGTMLLRCVIVASHCLQKTSDLSWAL